MFQKREIIAVLYLTLILMYKSPIMVYYTVYIMYNRHYNSWYKKHRSMSRSFLTCFFIIWYKYYDTHFYVQKKKQHQQGLHVIFTYSTFLYNLNRNVR